MAESIDAAADKALEADFKGETDTLADLRAKNKNFAALVAQHHALYAQIDKIKPGGDAASEAARSQLLKQRAKLLDDMANYVIEEEEIEEDSSRT